MQGWTFTRENWEEEMDKVKVLVAGGLVNAKLIDGKEADKWCASHTILLRKPPIFRRLIGIVTRKKEEEKHLYIIVKKA